MATKVRELRRLMDEGYEVLSIDSEADCVVAVLRRGARTATVRLFASDAEELLLRPRRLRHPGP